MLGIEVERLPRRLKAIARCENAFSRGIYWGGLVIGHRGWCDQPDWNHSVFGRNRGGTGERVPLFACGPHVERFRPRRPPVSFVFPVGHAVNRTRAELSARPPSMRRRTGLCD